MTLIEAMIAMAVVGVALLALVSLISSSRQVQEDSRERTLAYNAARQMVEEMRATIYLAQIYDKYKYGGSTGCYFRVDDLPAGTGPLMKSSSDATLPAVAAQGTIFFPEDKPGSGLTETPADARLSLDLGMPKDLNRDGDAKDSGLTSVSILPVKILVEWQTAGGKTSHVDVVTFITER